MNKYNDKYEQIIETNLKGNSIRYLTEFRSGNNKFVRYTKNGKCILVEYTNYFDNKSEPGFQIYVPLCESIDSTKTIQSAIDYFLK